MLEKKRIVFRVLLALSALVASTTLFAAPAHALDQTTELRSWETGLCLDSNNAGRVYTYGCNGGDYQRWQIIRVEGPTWHVIKNVATGRCLDSDHSGSLYTSGCHGGSWQDWSVFYNTGGSHVTKFGNRATNRVLDGNRGGAYTNFGDYGNVWQNWKRGF